MVQLKKKEVQVVYEKYEMVELKLPYIPSFLAFRECSALLKLIEDVKRERPEITPQLLMVDGNGILHERGFILFLIFLRF